MPAAATPFGSENTAEHNSPSPASNVVPIKSGVTPTAPARGGLNIQPASLPTLHQISADFVMLAASEAKAYHIASGDKLGKEAFIQFCAKHYGDIALTNADGKLVSRDSGAIWWDWKDASKLVVRQVVFEPTNQPADPFADVFNCWHVLRGEMVKPDHSATVEDIKPLIDHLMYISDGDRLACLYYLAWLAQLWRFPEVKIPWAIVNYSRFQGTGKTFLIQLEAKLFGASMVKNCDGSVLHKNFMDAMKNQRILGCNELARADRQDSHQRLKSLISEETLEFEGKGTASKGIRNAVHFHITTNNPDAVPVEDDDRRFLVMRCEQPARDQTYYDRLFAWLNGDGPAKLAGLFEQGWGFPEGWNPKTRPPLTRAAREMGIASRGELYDHLVQLKADRHPPFDRDLFTLDTVTKQYNTLYGDMARNGRVTRGQMRNALKSLFGDAVQLRMLNGAKDEKPRVYTAFNQAQWIAASPKERWDHLETGQRPFDATTSEADDHDA